MNDTEFHTLLTEKGIPLTQTQMDQFQLYYELLIEWNEKINLTAITERNEVYEKHFFDSISAAFYSPIKTIHSLCDVGAGAGFPSIPLKICFPHLHVTIVDSLNKRISFLEGLVSSLKLENVQLFHARAEEFGRRPEHREQYDAVTARAVARMSVLSELCIPLVKLNGLFIALKGSQGDEEWNTGKKAVSILGGELVEQVSFNLPYEEHKRTIYLIKKVKPTPNKYPRKPGMPNKQPLE
ncbi:16S rRNA m(7)G-527 methyltransferase [Bacillus oleivorans]|uniref:Ribosomal RNA small subunit methyltransferase G n=1 Tax=Bacillus oleivorans TaxID=1448271 RepID=A0A285CH79_9BACI|nr:16S rRNA (guanine(527)-N(7))-methyltransferase RsmG [Bacillus oleivorans]SNX66705.1 16S rRNA m(7)G-527 methyltransferase [Bacillus oleivorans]